MIVPVTGDVEHVDLADGRRCEVYVSGPVGGTPLVLHHGTPGGAAPVGVFERAAHERGLRLVVPARPGYGSSTRRAGRCVADVAVDTGAVVAALGHATCLVAGWSGGGPHALACGARLAGAAGVVVFASVAPHDAIGIDWTGGMGQDNLDEFGAAAHGEDALRALLEPAASVLASTPASQIGDMLASLLCDADRAVVAGEMGADLEASVRAGIATSADGWVDDDLAFVAPWGFPLHEVRVPTYLWQGSDDLMVPLAHGEWLGEHVPGITAHLLGGEGHLSIVEHHVGRALDELLAGAYV
ncbi:MAG: alpha/beta fold hydrolase [Acidimicrobiales bacterium]